jgi:alpha-L-fucosidase
LRQVGAWLARNGESIYGTTAGPFGAPPLGGLSWGGCTVRGETLYLHVLDWPEEGRIELPGLRSAVEAAYPLLAPEQRLAVTQGENGVWIDLPPGPLDELDTVIVARLDPASLVNARPNVDPPVVHPQEEGTLCLDYVSAQTAGRATKRYNRRGGFHISKWTAPEDRVTWHLELDAPGAYEVQVVYSAREAWAGREYVISAAGQALVGRVEASGGWHIYRARGLGTLTFDRAGRYTLRIAPRAAGEEDLMYLRAVELRRASER